jgi:hypothetical protein
MKKVFAVILFALPCIGFAQSKFSYDLIFGLSGVSNSSGKAVTTSYGNSLPIILNSSGTPILLTPASGNVYTVAVPQTKPITYKAKITEGFTFGGKMNYEVYKNIQAGIGVSVSYFKAIRSLNVTNTTSSFSAPLGFSGLLVTGSGHWDSTANFPAGTYNYPESPAKQDQFKFVTINIPLNINYSIAKWQLEAGVITSFIISNSKKTFTKTQYDPEVSLPPSQTDPSVQQPTLENTTKHFFSLSISPQYQLNNKIKIGIEYTHALNNVYSTNWYSQNDYPGMKTSSLGLKLLYKLK